MKENPWQRRMTERAHEAPRSAAQQPRQEARYEQPRRNRGFEKPVKKGGTFGGCLKKLLLWLIALIVVIGGILYGIGSCIGGSDEDDDRQNPAQFERIMTDQQVDSLVTAQGFPQTTDDVAPLAGEYVGSTQGWVITVTLKPEQNGKVVGRVKQEANAYTAVRDGFYCYCGNSVYAVYESERKMEQDKVQNYFFALPDRKSIQMIDGTTELILKRKDPPPVHKGKGKGTLLSRNYTLCMPESSLEVENEDFGYELKDEDHALSFGTYVGELEVKGEKHTITYVVDSYEGENIFILATVKGYPDNDTSKEEQFYMGYCGHSIYALYKCSEDRVNQAKSTAGLLYVFKDGKSFKISDKELTVEFKKQ